MRICIPTDGGEGMTARVHGHFGSAPCFVLHDTESGETLSIDNANEHHAHGMCHPAEALTGQSIDAVLVGGMGRRALTRLKGEGIRVFLAVEGTVGDNVTALSEGRLSELSEDAACAGHSGGCDD